MEIETRRLHPLDHPFRGCPKKLKHLRMKFILGLRKIPSFFAKEILCSTNRHDLRPFWTKGATEPSGVACRWCWYSLEEEVMLSEIEEGEE